MLHLPGSPREFRPGAVSTLSPVSTLSLWTDKISKMLQDLVQKSPYLCSQFLGVLSRRKAGRLRNTRRT